MNKQQRRESNPRPFGREPNALPPRHGSTKTNLVNHNLIFQSGEHCDDIQELLPLIIISANKKTKTTIPPIKNTASLVVLLNKKRNTSGCAQSIGLLLIMRLKKKMEADRKKD